MAHYKVAVENGNNILVTVDPSVSNVNVVLDRGVSGVGIENIEMVFISPDYFLKFYYTNGTTENVLLPATEATVLSFNTRIGVVTLNSADVTTALGYTPPTPTGTGATGTWGISVSGNAGTVTNGVYTTDTSTVTNTMLAGSIANNKLTNSAITINDTSTSLGGTVNVGTVTSVSGAGTVNGINLSGAVTTSGNLTLSGALTGVDLTSQVTGTLPVSNGGTSASNATNARTNLGLGTIATQNANSVAITGGTITGITLAVANGGTGASTLTGYVKGSGAVALSASTTIPSTDITGLGTIATQNANAVAITGGTITGITLAVANGGTGASTLTGYVKGSGAAALSASTTIPSTDITGLGTIATQNANAAAITGGSVNGTTVGATTASTVASTNLAYTGTLTGSTGIVNLGSGQVYKDASGNVGIGTSSPAAKLDVQGASGLLAQFLETTSGTSRRIRFSNSGVVNTIESTTASGSTSLAIAVDGSERMRIDSAGNVGIGTSSPAAKLHVAAASTTAASLTFGNTAGQIFRNEQSEMAIGLLNVAPFTLWIQGRNSTNDAKDITFQTLGGNVGIGTSSPTTKLHVAAASGDASQFICASGDNANIVTGRTGTTGYVGYFVCSGNLAGSITHPTTSTTLYNTASDYRLKNNQQPVTNSGTFIDGLKPKTWEWAKDGSVGVGFVAHEFAEVSPLSVSGEKDAVDKDGKPMYQSMQASSSEVMANIVAELQTLRARVATIESKQ